MGLKSFLQHSWSAFTQRDRPTKWEVNTSFGRPDRTTLSYNVDRTIVSSIYNRLAVDVSAVAIKHARIDQNGRFQEVINSKLNDRLNYYANKDQTGRDLIKDIVLSLCDEGCVAVVPTHTDTDPDLTQSFTINALRVCKIVSWHPDSIDVKAYNEDTGESIEVNVRKDFTAIIENPFYEIMNCPNSSLQRLIQKLNLLDKLDNEAGAGKLDIIIQLPYAIRNDLKREQAEQRRKDIEMQLVGSKYGIAYIDATEHITQLNRPAENTLVEQIKNLQTDVYAQLGLSEAIMNGTAGEQEMINYFNNTIEPFLSAISLAFEWKFISTTARTQGQSIYFYRDPFRLIPSEKLAEIADKFTRNEVLSPNEIRAIIGYKPSDDPESDKLRNRNLNQESVYTEENQNGSSDAPDELAEHSSIEHHGIKGQKWGIRRGPPYPIGSGDNDRSQDYGKKYTTSTQLKIKRSAISLAKYTISMLIPGAGLLFNAKAIKDTYDYNLDTKDYTKKDGDVETLSELKKKTSSSKDDIKAVNPGGGAGRVNNCSNCVAAYEMRSRGYDVEARRRASGRSMLEIDNVFNVKDKGDVRGIWEKDEKHETFVDRSVNELKDKLKSYGPGSRGYLGFIWEETEGGHVISWENNNGTVRFIDAQSGKEFKESSFGLTTQQYMYSRLDNATPSDDVCSYVVSVGRKNDD